MTDLSQKKKKTSFLGSLEKSREREKLKTLTAAAVHVGGFVEFKREKEKKSSRRFEQRSMEHTSTSHKKLDTVPLIFLLLIYHDNKILGMSEDIKYIHSVHLLRLQCFVHPCRN